MNRKDIINRLRELYRLRKSYSMLKNRSFRQYEELEKIRSLIDFYEGLIKSSYMDTWVTINKVSKKIDKDNKERRRRGKI